MDNRELFHGPRRYPESYSGRIPQKMCGARHTTSADHQGCNRQIPETKMKTPARWSTCRKTAHRGHTTDTGGIGCPCIVPQSRGKYKEKSQ